MKPIKNNVAVEITATNPAILSLKISAISSNSDFVVEICGFITDSEVVTSNSELNCTVLFVTGDKIVFVTFSNVITDTDVVTTE